MIHAACTKTNPLIDKLNDYLSGNEWNPDASDHFKAEALKVRNADVAEGDMLLGMIASLNNDIEEMERRFKNSLSFSGNSPAVIFNYGNSLYNNGFFSRAIQVLMPVAESRKDASAVIGAACKALGLVSKARYFLEKAGIDPDQEINFPESPNQKAAMQAVLESFGRDKKIWQSLSTR